MNSYIKPKVLEIQQSLQTEYPLSPLVYFENHCDQKRMKILAPIASELFDHQIVTMAAFKDFNFCYVTGSSPATLYYLADLYGSLNKRFKDFNATIKKYSKQPEVLEYYAEAQKIMSVNVFDMMMDDFKLMEPVFQTRRAIDVKRFPDHKFWEAFIVDLEIIKDAFKKAK